MTTALDRDLPDVPRELVEAGAGGRLVVLVGAGASFGAGLPSWETLLANLLAMGLVEAASQAQRERLEEAQREWFHLDALLKASLLGAVMGRDWVPEAIARRILEASPHPTGTHRALAALPGAAFVTTNYEQLLEVAIQEHSGRGPRRVLLSDVEGIRDFGTGDVLKLHGDIEAPRSIVLKTEDFYRVGHEAPRAWKERLKALLQPPSQILLVGYGDVDVDVLEVVNELRGAYEGKLRGPFWLEVGTFAASVKADAIALRPIWLKSDEHVVPWLEALAKAIETERARAPVVVKAAAYAGLVHEELRKKADVASAHFQARRYLAAQAVFQDILSTAERLAVAAPDEEDLRQWIARSRLNLAGCALCLQSADARDRLREVADHDVAHLKAEWRAQLSMGLAQTGDLDRARLVLPADDPSDEVNAARQLIEVKEGHLPNRPWASSSILLLHIASALANQGHLDEAARMARDLIQAEPEDVLLVFYSLGTLEESLRNSVHEELTLVRPIPMEDRAPTVEAIERHLDAMPGLPDALADDLCRLRFAYYNLTGDDERRALAIEGLGDDWRVVQDSRSQYELDMVRADKLAREGKLEDALALVQPTEHPWRHRFDRVQILAVARQFDEALVEIKDLARVWPGRASIEHLLAELLVHGSHPEEALPHARAAFAALPGRGFRLLLGRCLLAAGQAEEAWSALEPLQGSRNPELLRARAIAAERLPDHLKDAPVCWGEYLEVRPEDNGIRLRIARLRFQAGDPEGAASTAREAIDRGEAQLDAGSLYDCAQLVRVGGRFDEQARSYVRRVADLLHTRFPGDKVAEHHRFMLLGALGFPEDAQPVDFAALVAAGAMRPVRVDEVTEAFQNQNRFRDQVYRAYRLGHVPFESLCALTHTAAARYLIRFVHVASDRGPTALSTPVALGDGLPVPGLSGRRILIGELELLLLERFGLWRRLRAALGEKGKLILFSDVWARAVEAAGTLELNTQRVALEQQDTLLHLLINSPGRIKPEDEVARGSDSAWAAAKGLTIVDDAGPAGSAAISLRSLVGYLDAQGYIEREKAERLSSVLPVAEDPRPLDALPGRLCLSYAALQQLFETGALDSLLRIDDLVLVIGPDTMATVRGRCAMLREDVEAADLAAGALRAGGAGMAQGWIEASLPRPALADLPDVSDGPNAAWARQVSRQPLELGLSFRQALIDDPDLLLLTADFFVASEIGSHHREMLAVTWPSPAVALSFITRMRSPHEREIHLPGLVRYLFRPEETDVKKDLLDLARLGFTEALGPDDLLALAKTYGGTKGGGLDRQEPKSILDRLEWMVSEPDHLGAGMAFLRLADVYGKSIWQAFCDEKTRLPDESAKSLAISLLNRAEGIGENWGLTMVDLIVQFAGGSIMSKPMLSVRAPKLGDTVVRLSSESPGGKLWSCFVGWAGPEGSRRAAYGRAVRNLWLRVDELTWPIGPDSAQAAGLLLTLGVDNLSAIHPEIAAPAILSANWSERPLAGIHPPGKKGESVEDLLSRGAALVQAAPDVVFANESMVTFKSLKDGYGDPAIFPPEAVLLRTHSTEAFASFARHLARDQGQHDGQAYNQLDRLSRNPQDANLRHDFARSAVKAPWRLVRDNPTVIRTWGWQQRSGLGGVVSSMDIGRLREMLSEPAHAFGAKVSPWDALHDRLSSGNVWAAREDQVDLEMQACEVPGMLPALMVSTRLGREKAAYATDVGKALIRLEHPDEQTAARLAGDIFFLRIAADRRPHVSLPEGEIDLRERLPERLVAVLRSVMSSPLPDTLAHAEAGLLRLCGDVVQELASPRNLHVKDWLWLTYRLFQWLCAQLEAMAPDASQAGLISLRKVSPAPRSLSPEANDLLNPFRFDGVRFEHRLTTVLYAIVFMEALPARVPEGPEHEKETPRSVTSTALEELLVQLAARQLSEEERALRSRGDRPSCLDWYGPGAVPDLALQALLALNSGAILQMPEESRQRWILDLPRSPEDKERLPWPLAIGLVAALTENARGLSAGEKVALEDRLRSLEGPGAERLRWLGFNNLYGAGSIHLEDEVRALLLNSLSDPIAAQAFGSYLRALSFVAPDRLQTEAERVLVAVEARAAEHGPQEGDQSAPDPVAFAWGVGAVLVTGEPGSIPVAQDLLRRLAQRDPYRGNERMRKLFGILGLT